MKETGSSDTGSIGGQHAIVTGGARGIGAAISAALSRAGARVTIMGRDEAVLEKHAKSLGAGVTAIRCDVMDENSIASAFAKAGPAQILVNNAGQAKSEKFVRTSHELWNHMLAVNLTSTYLCTAQVLPEMLEAKGGRIVNIASTAGVAGAARMTAYAAAKHGVVGFTKSLSLEIAKSGVTVNAVCPGYTDTEMTERGVTELMEAKRISRDEARGLILRVIPRGVMTTPEEVASTVLWLCSPEASAITGQAIVVAGGETT
ncbi:MAG: SDR family NAD(P)-dependent oxidoreductase [Gemmatimonadaceae bacterium]|nr:SDR family NAD(P)-dependent oxidoreductase [Gemmatimonadaceae bacterium]